MRKNDICKLFNGRAALHGKTYVRNQLRRMKADHFGTNDTSGIFIRKKRKSTVNGTFAVGFPITAERHARFFDPRSPADCSDKSDFGIRKNNIGDRSI